MSIIDYLKENNKIFSYSSVSSVESLVLSQLSYYKFEKFKHNQSLGQILSRVDISDFSKTAWNKEKSEEFLKAILNNDYWSKIRFVDCVTLFDQDEEQQFTAMLFELKKGIFYIAFRGTDGTFTGWKEDFNLSFMTHIPSQKSAIIFTEDMIKKHDGYFFLGGHSKGGNLAHYTMLFMDEITARKVRRADSFDGPGIQIPDLDDKIEERKSKLLKFIPEHSVIGRIYEFDQDYVITVKSNTRLMYDHDPFSWIVKNKKFQLVENQSKLSNYVKETIDTFNKSLDDDTKIKFLSFVYEISKSLDTIYISEANANLKESSKFIIKAFRNANPDEKNTWRKIAKTFGKASLKSGSVFLPEKINKRKKK